MDKNLKDLEIFMGKVKIRNANMLLLTVVLLLTVAAQLAIWILYTQFNIDLGAMVKENENVKLVLLIIDQYALILLPVIIFIFMNRLDVRKVFRLNPINIPTVIITIIMAVAAWVIGQYITIIIYQIYSYIFGQPRNEMANIIPNSITLGFLLIALTPAICEEALFRGVMLKAYENRGTMRAIFISAILFALIHLSIIRFAGPLLIGILSGYLVVRSNSIIPGILTHFTFNGISMAIYYSVNRFPEEAGKFPTISEYFVLSIFVIFSIAIIAVGILAFNYFNPVKKTLEFDNSINRYFYNLIFGSAVGENLEFKRPIGSLLHDFVSIVSHWPVIIIIIIVFLSSLLEVISTIIK